MSVESTGKILLTESVRSIFRDPPGDEEVLWTAQPSKLLAQMIRDAAENVVPLLVVGPPNELTQLHSIFTETQSLRLAWAVYSLTPCDPSEFGRLEPLFDYRVGKVSTDEWEYLRARFQIWLSQIRDQQENAILAFKITDQIMDQEALIRIGKSLASERDPDKLLRTILFLSKKITGADAGSIFLLEEKDGERYLRFKYSHTFSMDLEYEEFVMPLDSSSIAGYVALTGKSLNIEDVYDLGPDAPIRFNSAFDQKHGYRTRSMLVTPMTDHQGRVIGLIQLINSKEKITPNRPLTGNEAFEVKLRTPEDFETLVVPFQKRYEEFMQAVAGQAAIAIENNRMIRQIERQFEEFIKAAVFAIESRDPATSGHSIRVAKMCLLLAQAINEETQGPLAEVRFTTNQLKELYYAALLHDFGKVYIDLSVFQKAKKLTPQQREILEYRIGMIHRTLELELAKLSMRPPEEREPLTAALTESLERLGHLRRKIDELVEPEVLARDRDQEIDELVRWANEIEVHDLDGRPVPVLTEEEIKNLRIPRGSLNDEERAVIQSHVTHTYNFVKKIPWPEEYARIPEIAAAHHEMMDGSGYPNHLTGDQIPLQGRIMAVADVFDALAAADRPYKKAIPLERVLAILKSEAEQGKLDRDIVRLFLDRQLYLQHRRFSTPSDQETPLLEVFPA